MEFTDALEEFSGTNDHNSIIVKGKRTKRRQRPLSPVGRAMAVTSSSSSGGGGGESGTSEGGGRDREVLGYIYSLIPSSTTCSSDISANTSTDQEDEDMANCLILLAQGESCRKQVDEEDDIKMEKFSSRRFNEKVSSTTGGKVGFFVYECKTCNRSFPSFQALGGHRASHKKPKVTIEEKKGTILAPNCIDDHHQEEEEEEEEEKEKQGQYNRLSPPLSVQSSNKLLPINGNNKKAKIHECGICGAEFSSGQALGGHMRRHRNHMTSTKVSMVLDTNPTHDHDDSSSHDVQKPRNIFPLDLNLPAPAEDDLHRDLKFQFSANQQPHLVFSAPAMVDCHY